MLSPYHHLPWAGQQNLGSVPPRGWGRGKNFHALRTLEMFWVLSLLKIVFFVADVFAYELLVSEVLSTLTGKLLQMNAFC